MLTRNHQQEALCRAYIHAVAACSGMSVSSPSPDYGIDLTINDIVTFGKRRIESGYKIDIQAKSTTQASLQTTHVRYDLDLRAFEALRRRDPPVPRLLVLFVLPAEDREWLSLSEESLILRRCAYWISLTGRRPIVNRRSLRVSIPRTQIFSPDSLRGMMERVKKGEKP